MLKAEYLKTRLTKILAIFFAWKIILLISLILAINYLPLAFQDRFLGGGLQNYLHLPQLFSWANFDGEHYLSISIYGYKGLEQAFFPVYPALMHLLSSPFYQSGSLFPALFYSTFFGLFISHLFLLLSLILLWDLIRIDYPEKISLLTVLLILIFPTSFYLGAIYSESTFLFFSVGAFYLARKKKWFWASVFGLIASATRIFGLMLLPALLIEARSEKAPFKDFFWIIMIPFGLIFYSLYQYQTVGDPLAFYNLQKIVGEQHRSFFTLLPQVYFRYLKILTTIDVRSSIYQTIVLEFITGIVFFLLPIYGYFKKVRLSYLVYIFSCLLISSIQGSFTSLPRYVLVFFPAFLILALWLDTKPRWFKTIFIAGLVLVLGRETMLFLKGYWVG